MRRLTQFLLSFCLLWGVQAGVCAVADDVSRAPVATRVFKVGVLEDNFPYSYRDNDGVMKGFAYEVVQEIERVMGLRFERVVAPTAQIHADFAAGRVDLLQSMAQFPERDAMADFSVPYLTMTGAIFVRDSERSIQGVADLRGRRVLVHAGSLGEAVLRRAGLAESIVIVDSVEQAFTGLERGEGDATLATRLSGMAMAERLQIRGVHPLPGEVSGYEVRYCVTVKKGDATLLAQVNEGLAILVSTGRFDAIYQKWFGRLEPKRYSAAQIVGAVAVGLALALVVAVAAMVRQRHLRKKISAQAEELRASEERHRGIFEDSRDGLVVIERVDGKLQVEQINPAAVRMLGREVQPKEKLTLAELVRSDVALNHAIETAIHRGGSSEFEHERSDGSGSLRARVTPLGAKSLLALTDVTEAVVARKRLQQQEEQLRQKQKLEAVGTLAGGVAHDFNNLLTAIMGNTELSILELGRDHPQTSGLKLALTAAKRARDLVQQILTFSRQNTPKREVVALGPLVDETIHLLRTLARGAVEFEAKMPAELSPILADPAQVHQVLMNLGTNAVQAMRGSPGRLSFSAEVIEVGREMQAQHPDLRMGRYVRVALLDTGPGMSPEVQRRVFEPYFTTKAPGDGTGLGLSVVHGIMQQHGGVVTLYSQVGRGTLFHLYFPEAAENAKAKVTVPPVAAPAPLRFGQGRVLFVDDDPAVVQTTRGMLAHLGYEVRTHTRPEDALADFEQNPTVFDLVISDLTMPGMNGLQLLGRVRGLQPKQSCVLISGFFSDTESRAAVTLGVVLLPKPLSYESLGKAAAAALVKR